MLLFLDPNSSIIRRLFTRYPPDDNTRGSRLIYFYGYINIRALKCSYYRDYGYGPFPTCFSVPRLYYSIYASYFLLGGILEEILTRYSHRSFTLYLLYLDML